MVVLCDKDSVVCEDELHHPQELLEMASDHLERIGEEDLDLPLLDETQCLSEPSRQPRVDPALHVHARWRCSHLDQRRRQLGHRPADPLNDRMLIGRIGDGRQCPPRPGVLPGQVCQRVRRLRVPRRIGETIEVDTSKVLDGAGGNPRHVVIRNVAVAALQLGRIRFTGGDVLQHAVADRDDDQGLHLQRRRKRLVVRGLLQPGKQNRPAKPHVLPMPKHRQVGKGDITDIGKMGKANE